MANARSSAIDETSHDDRQPHDDAPQVDFTMAQVGAEEDSTRVQRLHLEASDDDAAQFDEEGSDLGGDRIDRATFCEMFCDGWSVPGMVRPIYAPLALTAERRPAGMTTGGVIFDYIAPRYPWLIPPKSALSVELFIALAFCKGQFETFQTIRAEEAEARRRAREAAYDAS
ncbi:MAG: hypothetical protein GC186_16480 [Rhodobacteraceae bacterium]|nr:hypothetical protein [Paracoccaceae bacterium]